jgi:hypothetical protein
MWDGLPALCPQVGRTDGWPSRQVRRAGSGVQNPAYRPARHNHRLVRELVASVRTSPCNSTDKDVGMTVKDRRREVRILCFG